MFKKLEGIDFEKLREIDFQPQKWKDEFGKYFTIMEKIFNLFLELEKYENIFSDIDKNTIKKDIILFSNILNNVGNKGWKDPNNSKFKKEKFNQNYINWLNARKSIYEHNNNLLNSKDEDYSKKLTDLKEEKDKIIGEKNTEIEKLTGDKESLNETITSLKKQLKKMNHQLKN